MRSMIGAMALGALLVAGFAFTVEPVSAAKTKMGCEKGKEYWDAAEGKCMAGKPPKKKATKKSKEE